MMKAYEWHDLTFGGLLSMGEDLEEARERAAVHLEARHNNFESYGPEDYDYDLRALDYEPSEISRVPCTIELGEFF